MLTVRSIRRQLANKRQNLHMKIFIDTNIGRRATTHVTEMVPQPTKWGPVS